MSKRWCAETRILLCKSQDGTTQMRHKHSPCCLSLGRTCILCYSPGLRTARQTLHPAERQTDRDYKQCFGNTHNESCDMWSNSDCRAWGTAARVFAQIPSWIKPKTETEIPVRSPWIMWIWRINSCVSEKFADLWEFKRDNGIQTRFRKESDPVTADTGCWLTKCNCKCYNYILSVTCMLTFFRL